MAKTSKAVTRVKVSEAKAKAAETKVNVRAEPIIEVGVIPTDIYRGILRITTKSESKTAHETNAYTSVEEKDILLNASPSTVREAFDAVIEEIRNTFQNPDMVTIELIEYRNLSTDSNCYTVF